MRAATTASGLLIVVTAVGLFSQLAARCGPERGWRERIDFDSGYEGFSFFSAGCQVTPELRVRPAADRQTLHLDVTRHRDGPGSFGFTVDLACEPLRGDALRVGLDASPSLAGAKLETWALSGEDYFKSQGALPPLQGGPGALTIAMVPGGSEHPWLAGVSRDRLCQWGLRIALPPGFQRGTLNVLGMQVRGPSHEARSASTKRAGATEVDLRRPGPTRHTAPVRWGFDLTFDPAGDPHTLERLRTVRPGPALLRFFPTLNGNPACLSTEPEACVHAARRSLSVLEDAGWQPWLGLGSLPDWVAVPETVPEGERELRPILAELETHDVPAQDLVWMARDRPEPGALPASAALLESSALRERAPLRRLWLDGGIDPWRQPHLLARGIGALPPHTVDGVFLRLGALGSQTGRVLQWTDGPAFRLPFTVSVDFPNEGPRLERWRRTLVTAAEAARRGAVIVMLPSHAFDPREEAMSARLPSEVLPLLRALTAGGAEPFERTVESDGVRLFGWRVPHSKEQRWLALNERGAPVTLTVRLPAGATAICYETWAPDAAPGATEERRLEARDGFTLMLPTLALLRWSMN